MTPINQGEWDCGYLELHELQQFQTYDYVYMTYTVY